MQGDRIVSKAYITLELKEPYRQVFEEIKKLIAQIIGENNIEFSNAPHITLDFMGISELEIAIDKLNKLQGKFDYSLSYSIKSMKIGSFRNFTSNVNGKSIFYLEIEGGELFFSFLRSNGYSIQTPHITIFETTNGQSEEVVISILNALNSNIELLNLIKKLILNVQNIYLRNKPKGKELEIIQVLQLCLPDSSQNSFI